MSQRFGFPEQTFIALICVLNVLKRLCTSKFIYLKKKEEEKSNASNSKCEVFKHVTNCELKGNKREKTFTYTHTNTTALHWTKGKQQENLSRVRIHAKREQKVKKKEEKKKPSVSFATRWFYGTVLSANPHTYTIIIKSWSSKAIFVSSLVRSSLHTYNFVHKLSHSYTLIH